MTPNQWGTVAMTGVGCSIFGGSIGGFLQMFIDDPESASNLFVGFGLTGLVIGLVVGWFYARENPYK